MTHQGVASGRRDEPAVGDHPGHRADHRLGDGGDGGDATVFATGRHFAAWLGLTPREFSSGLKRRTDGSGKRGNGYLRRLLILGAHSVMRHDGSGPPKGGTDRWLAEIRSRRPPPIVAVALAN